MRQFDEFGHGDYEHLRPKPLLRDHEPGQVYFVSCDWPDFPVKIGFARDVHKRCNALQTGLPYRVVLLAQIGGNRRQERHLHRLFEPHRTRGDWFFRHPQIIEVIAAVRQGEPLPQIQRAESWQDYGEVQRRRQHNRSPEGIA